MLAHCKPSWRKIVFGSGCHLWTLLHKILDLPLGTAHTVKWNCLSTSCGLLLFSRPFHWTFHCPKPTNWNSCLEGEIESEMGVVKKGYFVMGVHTSVWLSKRITNSVPHFSLPPYLPSLPPLIAKGYWMSNPQRDVITTNTSSTWCLNTWTKTSTSLSETVLHQEWKRRWLGWGKYCCAAVGIRTKLNI